MARDDDDEDEDGNANVDVNKKGNDNSEKVDETNKNADEKLEPPPPAIIVTPQEVLDSMESQKTSYQSSFSNIEENIMNLQKEYFLVTGVDYKSSVNEIAEILLTNYFYYLVYKRKDLYFKTFYRENSILSVDCDKQIVNENKIIVAIIDSLADLKIEINLDPFDFDACPPNRCNAFVKCNYFLKVFIYFYLYILHITVYIIKFIKNLFFFNVFLLIMSLSM